MNEAQAPSRRTRAKSITAGSASASRDRILTTAARLFRQKGYRGTTVRDIGETVGMLSGSLFSHFGSKEEMLLEIMREAFLAVSLSLEQILAKPGTDPAKMLREMLKVDLNLVVDDDHKDFHAVVYLDWRDVPPASMPELERYRHRYRNCWRTALLRCHAAGRLRCEPDMAEHIVLATMRDAALRLKPHSRHTATQFAETLVDLLTRDR